MEDSLFDKKMTKKWSLNVNCTTQNYKPCADGIYVHSKMNPPSTFGGHGMVAKIQPLCLTLKVSINHIIINWVLGSSKAIIFLKI